MWKKSIYLSFMFSVLSCSRFSFCSFSFVDKVESCSCNPSCLSYNYIKTFLNLLKFLDFLLVSCDYIIILNWYTYPTGSYVYLSIESILSISQGVFISLMRFLFDFNSSYFKFHLSFFYLSIYKLIKFLGNFIVNLI